MQTKMEARKGFTLLEILLVVAAISILAGIVIVALNPGKQLAESRDAERRAHVNTLLNGIYQYSIDNEGNFPDGLKEETQVVGSCDQAECDGTTMDCVDLSGDLTPLYLVNIPADPRYEDDVTGDKQYYVEKDADDRITVGACQPEEVDTISVTR
jgi:prepilin-type N-terminal cleavage/methylation domain-containing protein